MTDSRKPHEIEQDIERHRAHLTSNLDALQENLSLDSLVEKVSGFCKKNGAAVGRSVVQVAREKPLAVAMTGIGLYWLIAGNSSKSSPARNQARRIDSLPSEKPRPSLPAWAQNRNEEVRQAHRNFGQNHQESNQTSDDSLKSKLDSATSNMGDALSTAKASVKSKLSSATDGISDSIASAKSAVNETWGDARDLLSEKTDSLRERLTEGTENFSVEARNRIIAARAHALQALQDVQQAAQAGSEKAVGFFEARPLVVGALAMAAGAALGGSLPTTQAENHTFGSYSDALIEEAERIFKEEKQKAEQVAATTVEKAKDVSAEIKEDLKDQAEDGIQVGAEKIRDIGSDLVETAKAEAENRKLGKPLES